MKATEKKLLSKSQRLQVHIDCLKSKNYNKKMEMKKLEQQIDTALSQDDFRQAVHNLIKAVAKKSFDAGYKLGEFEASTVDWDRSKNVPQETKFKNFKDWYHGI